MEVVNEYHSSLEKSRIRIGRFGPSASTLHTRSAQRTPFLRGRSSAKRRCPDLPAPVVGVIEIGLAGGTRVRITGAVDVATLSAAVAALAAKER
jgi:hypothetical protein